MQRRDFVKYAVTSFAGSSVVWRAGMAAAQRPPRGFVALFDGKDLSAWRADDEAKKHWVVRDGIIDFDGKDDGPKGEKRHLWSVKEYADLTLMVDWRFPGPARQLEHEVILPNGDYVLDEAGKRKKEKVMDAGDSGIYLRGSDKSQVNIWCWPIGSGEVYGYRNDMKLPAEVRAGVTPKKHADRPIGSWNSMVVTMVGDRLTVTLNNIAVITKAQLPGIAPSGPIALQNHGDPIQFRNIFIRTGATGAA